MNRFIIELAKELVFADFIKKFEQNLMELPESNFEAFMNIVGGSDEELKEQVIDNAFSKAIGTENVGEYFQNAINEKLKEFQKDLDFC